MRTRTPIRRDMDVAGMTEADFEKAIARSRDELRKATGSEEWPRILIVPSPTWAKLLSPIAERNGLEIVTEMNPDPRAHIDIADERPKEARA